MKFTIDKSVLSKGINKVKNAVDKSQSLPPIRGILIDSSASVLSLTATDLTLTIQHIIHDVEVEKPGTILIQGKFLNDLLRKLSGSLTFESIGDKLKLTCGDLTANINLMDDEDFPGLSRKPTTQKLILNTNLLKNALSKAIAYTTTNDNRPIFECVMMETSSNEIAFVSTDTHRLAESKLPIDYSNDFKANVPAKAFKELVRTFEGETTDIEIEDDLACFCSGDTRIFVKLFVGDFPNYKEVAIPKEKPLATLSVNRKLFKKSCERVNIFCDKFMPIIKLSGDSNLSVSGSSDLFGEVKETLKAVHEGEKIKIAFNSEFLLQAANLSSDEDMKIEYFGPYNLMIVREENYMQLILPVRVN